MNDKLMKDIETVVDDIFKKKEEAEMKKETEAALTKAAETINHLNESLEAKDDEHKDAVVTLKSSIASLEAKVEEMTEAQSTLNDEKAAFDTEKEELTKRAEYAEEELSNIKKEQLATERMSDIITAGVVSTSIDTQKAKVKEMSEEEFATYKEELIAIKDAILKEMEASSIVSKGSKDKATADAESTKEAAKEAKKDEVLKSRLSELKEAGAEVTGEDEIVKIRDMDDASFTSFKEEVLASIDTVDYYAIDPMKAIASALNMEVKPNEDMVAKYQALGSAMAESIKAKKG